MVSLSAFIFWLFFRTPRGEYSRRDTALVSSFGITRAISRRSLIGRIATIALGTARQGEPAQARVRDRHGRAHYVMVLPDRADDVFEDGTEVLLVKQDGAAFRAIENTNKAMVDT